MAEQRLYFGVRSTATCSCLHFHNRGTLRSGRGDMTSRSQFASNRINVLWDSSRYAKWRGSMDASDIRLRYSESRYIFVFAFPGSEFRQTSEDFDFRQISAPSEFQQKACLSNSDFRQIEISQRYPSNVHRQLPFFVISDSFPTRSARTHSLRKSDPRSRLVNAGDRSFPLSRAAVGRN